MNLTIRRAVPADEAVLVEFNLAIAWETEHKRLNRDVLTVGVRAVFADAARGFYTVAENDRGEVVGQMMVTYEWSDWRNGWFWWVQSVYVRARPDKTIGVVAGVGGLLGASLAFWWFRLRKPAS